MKNLSAGLQAHLDTGATTLAWCWKVTRQDALVQGFTDHDEPVTFLGVTYEAASGFTASEVEKALGLSLDNLTAEGALSSDSLNEADLAAGRYDNAMIEIWRVNWANTSERVVMHKGPIGEVTRGRVAFEAELLGLAEALNRPVGRVFAYACDADLGDARCGIDLDDPDFKGAGAVDALIDQRRFAATGLGAFDDQWFSFGKLTWTSGANDGRAAMVKRHLAGNSVTIELWAPMSEAIAETDTFTITAGCDKQFPTCREKFDNVVNFRGFPHMIGADGVVAYPNRDTPMDGGSRYGN